MSSKVLPIDPLLHFTNDRFILFPIKHNTLWTFYKQAQASYWTPEEIDLSEDCKCWQKMTEDERHYLTHVFAFFAASDGVVLENLASKFSNDVAAPEARLFYAFQQAVEAVHAETYALIIDTLVKDSQEKRKIFNAIATYPCVGAKANWAQRWINGDKSNVAFCERLIAFACVEGIFFSGSFCAIFWLKKRGLMPGVCFSNELISRDEGLHRDFACHLHQELKVRCSQDTVLKILLEAVNIEKLFVTTSLPVDLIGMNAEEMKKYIEFVADHLLLTLGFEKHFKTQNPFDWMELISLQGKTNFFEKRVGDYQKNGVASGDYSNYAFATNHDF